MNTLSSSPTTSLERVPSKQAIPFFIWLALALLLPSVSLAEPRLIPAGYSVETIEIPDAITLGVGGLAFNADGDLLICTREGQVWRYEPRTSAWHLFADGLHEPLGLHIDQDSGRIWVMQRPELTELVDEDGDGKADLYKTVTAAWGLTDNYHEYAFGPVRDSDGNFYGTLNTSLSWAGWAGSTKWDIGRVHDGKMGRATKYRGWSFQVRPDGTFVPWSHGMRSPAGIGMSREGDIFYTDNQGDWNGSSTLHHVVRDRFHGHPSSLMDHPKFQARDLNAIPVEEYAQLRTPPAVYFIHGDLANSPGEPTFIYQDGKFGPFDGQIIVGDQTRSNLMRIFLEKVGGQWQGCIFNFIDPLQCGVIRQVFDNEGTLWVGQTGRGWRSVGSAIFGLQRVRHDPSIVPCEIQSIEALPDGFRLRFTRPMNSQAIAQAAKYRIRHFYYHYRPEYGSPRVDQQDVAPTQLMASADGRSVDLKLPMLSGRIYEFRVEVPSADGTDLSNQLGWYTLNAVPEASR